MLQLASNMLGCTPGPMAAHRQASLEQPFTEARPALVAMLAKLQKLQGPLQTIVGGEPPLLVAPIVMPAPTAPETAALAAARATEDLAAADIFKPGQSTAGAAVVAVSGSCAHWARAQQMQEAAKCMAQGPDLCGWERSSRRKDTHNCLALQP